MMAYSAYMLRQVLLLGVEILLWSCLVSSSVGFGLEPRSWRPEFEQTCSVRLQHREECDSLKRGNEARNLTKSAALAIDAMRALFGGEDKLRLFFEKYFERSSFLLRYSKRLNREAWTRLYSRLARNENIEAILAQNASVNSNASPLILTKDIDLTRLPLPEEFSYRRKRIASFSPKNVHPNRAADLAKVQDAVKDGFELTLHNMESRSENTARIISRLREFWGTKVSAELVFAPPLSSKIKGRIAPLFFAEDTFVIQLDGVQDVTLHPNFIEFPTKDDEFNHDVIRDSFVRLLRSGKQKENKTISMSEGDFLYIPRGTGVDCRTTQKSSLHMAIKLDLLRSTIKDGILRVLKHKETDQDDSRVSNFLDMPLARTELKDGTIPFSPTWRDLMRATVSVASLIMPKMRRFLPFGPSVKTYIQEERGTAAEDMLRDEIGVFAKAAQDTLLMPTIEVLRENGSAIRSFTSKALVDWARNIDIDESPSASSTPHVQRLSEIYKYCLREMMDGLRRAY